MTVDESIARNSVPIALTGLARADGATNRVYYHICVKRRYLWVGEYRSVADESKWKGRVYVRRQSAREYGHYSVSH